MSRQSLLLLGAWWLGLAGGSGCATSTGPGNNNSNDNGNGNGNSTERCGDGQLDPGEDCDGIALGGATCTSLQLGTGSLACDDLCAFVTTACVADPFCGDGVTDPDEQCDDGSANSDLLADACRSDCQLAHCGDGIQDGAEACDDGTANADLVPNACRSDCTQAACGDDVVDSGEQCDGPSAAACVPAACQADCQCAPLVDPCADPVTVGDATCVILEIIQTAIGSNGFNRRWRGQDIGFGEAMVVTGVEFMSQGNQLDEIRVMTAVTNLGTLGSSTTMTRYADAAGNWEQVSFVPAVALLAGTEYTAWFHLSSVPAATPGCNLTLANAAWGGHHTDADPEGQSAVATSDWNYTYGTNIRVYGYLQ